MIYFGPSFHSRLCVIPAMLKKLAPIGSAIFTSLLPVYEADRTMKIMAAAMTFYFWTQLCYYEVY